MAQINKTFVGNLLKELNKGLGAGLGYKPGDFCVEQCVSIAEAREDDPDLDIEEREFSDGPSCVDEDLRSCKINLNDGLKFSSNKDRASALRRIAVAQLGTSKGFDYHQFINDVQAGIDAILPKPNLQLPVTVINTQDDIEKLKDFLGNELDGYYVSELALPESYIIRFDGDYNEPSEVFNSVIDALAKNATQRKAVRDQLIEIAVQALVKQKTPGSKYLKLTETATKKSAKTSKKGKR